MRWRLNKCCNTFKISFSLSLFLIHHLRHQTHHHQVLRETIKLNDHENESFAECHNVTIKTKTTNNESVIICRMPWGGGAWRCCYSSPSSLVSKIWPDASGPKIIPKWSPNSVQILLYCHTTLFGKESFDSPRPRQFLLNMTKCMEFF